MHCTDRPSLAVRDEQARVSDQPASPQPASVEVVMYDAAFLERISLRRGKTMREAGSGHEGMSVETTGVRPRPPQY
jgi:hypothetical protein